MSKENISKENIEELKDVINTGQNIRLCYDIGNGYTEDDIKRESNQSLKIIDGIEKQLKEYQKMKELIEENIYGDMDEQELTSLIKDEYHYNEYGK